MEMLGWLSFVLVVFFGYLVLLLGMAVMLVPKLRSNMRAYICAGVREADQFSEMSDNDKADVLKSTEIAAERKESECAICLEAMGAKKIVLLCSHAFCVFCVINFVKSQHLRQIACPTCRQSVRFLSILDEGPDGPAPEQKDFIRTYNRRIIDTLGPLNFLENLPFILHR